ncbi:MAG: YidC/Oxa1 family insertase periplasmic-domain containing protein, partial [Desulfosarcina sp.]|nr:YidC/Oxa1 family insertase periplasmic-domain containing protein [Desulfosarcina sp.]
MVLFVWSMFFVDQQPATDNRGTVTADKAHDDVTTPSKAAVAMNTSTSKEEIDSMKAAQVTENQGREITVETPFYTVRISARGAFFSSYILKKYRETVDTNSPNKQLIPPSFKAGVIRTSLLGNSLNGLNDAIFSIDQDGDRLVVD